VEPDHGFRSKVITDPGAVDHLDEPRMAPPGGKEAFPVLPAYDPQASKPDIHWLKPWHPTPRLFQRYRW
jgi:hypothetical protein